MYLGKINLYVRFGPLCWTRREAGARLLQGSELSPNVNKLPVSTLSTVTGGHSEDPGTGCANCTAERRMADVPREAAKRV